METAKTGERVDIPLFPMLAEELVKAKAKAGTSEFCFPEAALMYRSNPDGITWRVKQVLARALEVNPSADPLPSRTIPDEIRTKVDAYLATLGNSPRAAKICAVFNAYLDGASLDQVQEVTGASRGTVSNYLNELERETGASIVRGQQRAVKTDELQKERENGQRRASLHDFHSFRSRGSHWRWRRVFHWNWCNGSPAIGLSLWF